MKTSLDKAKKLISTSNGGYNYYNKILIETTPDPKKNREFMIDFYGLNRKLIKIMEESNRSVQDLVFWIRRRNELELDNNYRVRFLFNNLIPVNSKEEALEKWGCEQDIDICSYNIYPSNSFGISYCTSRTMFRDNIINKKYLFNEKMFFNLVNYCKDNISFKNKGIDAKTYNKKLDNITLIEQDSNDFIDSFTLFIYKEYFSKKPIGKKFCETLSKKYPDYKITYLMDNALAEELEYITYKDGEVIREIKPQGKEGDEYNGPNSPYLKAVSIIDDPCYIICPECGKIIDNYKVASTLECPYCEEELKKYDNVMKNIISFNHDYDEEDY